MHDFCGHTHTAHTLQVSLHNYVACATYNVMYVYIMDTYSLGVLCACMQCTLVDHGGLSVPGGLGVPGGPGTGGPGGYGGPVSTQPRMPQPTPRPTLETMHYSKPSPSSGTMKPQSKSAASGWP